MPTLTVTPELLHELHRNDHPGAALVIDSTGYRVVELRRDLAGLLADGGPIVVSGADLAAQMAGWSDEAAQRIAEQYPTIPAEQPGDDPDDADVLVVTGQYTDSGSDSSPATWWWTDRAGLRRVDDVIWLTGHGRWLSQFRDSWTAQTPAQAARHAYRAVYDDAQFHRVPDAELPPLILAAGLAARAVVALEDIPESPTPAAADYVEAAGAVQIISELLSTVALPALARTRRQRLNDVVRAASSRDEAAALLGIHPNSLSRALREPGPVVR